MKLLIQIHNVQAVKTVVRTCRARWCRSMCLGLFSHKSQSSRCTTRSCARSSCSQGPLGASKSSNWGPKTRPRSSSTRSTKRIRARFWASIPWTSIEFTNANRTRSIRPVTLENNVLVESNARRFIMHFPNYGFIQRFLVAIALIKVMKSNIICLCGERERECVSVLVKILIRQDKSLVEIKTKNIVLQILPINLTFVYDIYHGLR